MVGVTPGPIVLGDMKHQAGVGEIARRVGAHCSSARPQLDSIRGAALPMASVSAPASGFCLDFVLLPHRLQRTSGITLSSPGRFWSLCFIIARETKTHDWDKVPDQGNFRAERFVLAHRSEAHPTMAGSHGSRSVSCPQ